MVFHVASQAQGDELLFHYTTAAGLAGILHSAHLRLSPLKAMNDPRESKDFAFGIEGDLPAGFDHTTIDPLVRQASDLLRADIYVACFTAEDLRRDYRGFGARGFTHARSWAQYAEAHRGAVIVFNRPKLEQKLTGLHSHVGLVAYDDAPALAFSDGTWANFHGSDFGSASIVSAAMRWRSDHWRDLYFRKNIDWSSENEYRFIAFAKQPPVVSIAGTIEGIVLGEAFPAHEADVLAVRLARLGISQLMMTRLDWRNGSAGAGDAITWLPGLERARPPVNGTLPDHDAFYDAIVTASP